MEEQEFIEIYGAREHNLKNIDVKIPRDKLVVITGVSGSGKSSLAFDTIYAEGQRRYMESFSAYARSFIGNMERPEVDKIEGLSPVISIEQKTTSKNPRSTVGTTTEIYDFLRLLYARAGIAKSYVTGEEMIKRSEEEILNTIIEKHDGEIVLILAPVIKGRKGHYRELFVQIRKMGYTRVRVDGEVMELAPKMQLDRYKTHDIEIVIDRVCVDAPERFRIGESVKASIKHGKGVMSILDGDETINHYSKFLMCPTSGIAYEEPAPNSFSFNSPYGACPECNGLGKIEELTESSIVPDPTLSITQGAIGPLGDFRNIWIFKEIEKLMNTYNVDIKVPFQDIPDELGQILLYGGEYTIVKENKAIGLTSKKKEEFEGIIHYLTRHMRTGDEKANKNIKEFMEVKTCPSCNGNRLKKESLHFFIDNKNISELAQMDIASLGKWFEGLEERLTEKQKTIASEVLKEIRKRSSGSDGNRKIDSQLEFQDMLKYWNMQVVGRSRL